jgi:hypothetical protein
MQVDGQLGCGPDDLTARRHSAIKQPYSGPSIPWPPKEATQEPSSDQNLMSGLDPPGGTKPLTEKE